MYSVNRFHGSQPEPTTHDRVNEEAPPYAPDARPRSPSSTIEAGPPSAIDTSSSSAIETRTDHRRHEARTLRLAMALIEGASDASNDRAANAAALRAFGRRAGGASPAPADDASLVARLHHLARSGERNLAEQLRLLPAFEASDLWRAGGCRDCAAWMDRELGIARITALERLRVARALATLPTLESLFAVGRLGWSKLRELTRVADAGCEAELAASALELSVSETVELCRRWRFGSVAAPDRDGAESDDGFADGSTTASADAAEASAAMRAFDERRLAWREVAPGRIRITLELPTDSAAEYLRALECVEDELRAHDRDAADAVREAPSEGEPASARLPAARSARQYRADAAVLMSAKALAHAGEAVSTADRYRVLVDVDARLLVDDPHAAPLRPDEPPPERPTLPGFGPISIATARRIAQSAGLTVVATQPNGEVVGVGASTRAWPVRLERAIRARDRHCQMPGCTATRWTHVHHVLPVADGGETAVGNGALMCGGCHRRLHEGGLRLERVCADGADLGAVADTLGLDADAAARARGRTARVQRFRLVRADGAVVAGPGRRVSAGSGSTGSFDPSGPSGREGVRVERLGPAGSVVSTWKPWRGAVAPPACVSR